MEFNFEFKPDLLFLSETSMNASVLLQELAIPSYSTLIANHNDLNCYGHGLGAYIVAGAQKMRTIISHICVSMWHLSLVAYSFSLSILLRTIILDQISEKIDYIVTEFISVVFIPLMISLSTKNSG